MTDAGGGDFDPSSQSLQISLVDKLTNLILWKVDTLSGQNSDMLPKITCRGSVMWKSGAAWQGGEILQKLCTIKVAAVTVACSELAFLFIYRELLMSVSSTSSTLDSRASFFVDSVETVVEGAPSSMIQSSVVGGFQLWWSGSTNNIKQ